MKETHSPASPGAARCERPSGRSTAKERDEIAPTHVEHGAHSSHLAEYALSRQASPWADLNCSESGPMSALGHKQTFGKVCSMSGLPPKVDIDPRVGA